MTDTRRGLLAAILRDPDDDGVRLVMADWLEENGEPERAEFIRVQVELAALGGCEFLAKGQEKECERTSRPTSISCRWCVLRHRELELLTDPILGPTLLPSLPTNAD